MIPAFRADGYLPVGLHLAEEAEVTFRFGAANPRRRRLVLRVRRWIELARQLGAPRLMIDGSFVTAKAAPHDVDAVILLFAAEDETDWDEWIEFFSRTRESDSRRKGLVEIEL